MKSIKQLYEEARAGFANIRIVTDEENTMYLIPVTREMRQADCFLEDIIKEKFQYTIEAVKEENYTEVPTTVQHELTFEQYSQDTYNANFKFSWQDSFKGFIVLKHLV